MGWEPFSSVHRLLRCNINAGVHARGGGACMSHSDVTIAWEGKRGYRVRVTSRVGSARRILGDFEKSVSRVETRHHTIRVDFRLLAEALGRCRTRSGEGRWKNQNRKILPLFPYVEKPLNSKVIKSFVPELRSRKCFSCFEIPMFYVIYIWTLYVHIWRLLWLWYTARI